MKALTALVFTTALLAGCQPALPKVLPTPGPAEPPPRESLHFFNCEDHLNYATKSDEAPCEVRRVDGYSWTVSLDRNIVSLTVPYGWEAYPAGNGAWVSLQRDSRARIIIYPVKPDELHGTFMDEWYNSYLKSPEITKGFYHAGPSRYGPFLARYTRSDDKLGVVYGRTYEPARWNERRTAAIVHGLWPTEYDWELIPLAMAVANTVQVVL